MADEPIFTADTQPTLQQLIDYLVEQFHDPEKVKRWETALTNAHAKGSVTATGAVVAAIDWGLDKAASFLFGVEEHIEKLAGPPLTRLAGHLIGQDVSIAELRRAADASGESVVGGAVAKLALDALSAPIGELEPGDDRAKRFLSMLGQLVVNGWFESTAFELVTTLFPDMDGFESVAELPRELIDALGLGRLARVALRPLAQIGVATPLEWQLHKAHRPTMLGDAAVVRAFLRGDYTADEAREELARAGYSDKRIDALVADALKWPALGELMIAVRDGQVTRDYVIAQLRRQGYDDVGAERQLTTTEGALLAAIHDDSFAAVRAAYVDRRISDAEFEQFLTAIYPDDAFRNAHEVAARTIRDVNTKFLTSSQAAECVKAKILPVQAYREALDREGYVDADATALELLLQKQIDASLDVEQARQDKAAQAAAAAKATADAVAAKKADAEAAAALKRRGSPAELTRAAVRGLIPIARALDVIGAGVDADTLAIYKADIEQQRADYLAQQQKAADAATRAANKGLNVGQLEQAVLAGVLTLDNFREQLTRQGTAPADVAILVATLAVRVADATAAAATRRDAEQRAKAKRIDLTTFEQLVRRGIRPMADYDALLSTLGYGDADRAALRQLLQQKIDQDAAAATLRADTAAANAPRGLSLEQFRRAVILGVKTLQQFQAWLVQQKYSVDAAIVLAAELQDDVTQADAARRRRVAADAAGGASALPLSTIARAARIGVLTPAEYQAALVARGYSADDVAVELALLANEIADVRNAGAIQAAADARRTDTGLSLAQLAAAVKAGETPLAVYRGRALALGVSDDDAALLTRVLGDELAATIAAKARRATLQSTVKPGDVSIGVLGQRVIDGSLTVGAFRDTLIAAGLDPVDIDLLVSLLTPEGLA